MENKIDIPKERLQKFFKIAWERHRIYVLKTIGCSKPWTQDLIFQNYYFCNVFRRIDKTTDYLVEKIIKKNENNPLLWKTIMLFRFISRLDTYKVFASHEFDYPWLYRYMREAQKQGTKLFTNAFILNSGRKDKVTYIWKLLKWFDQSCGNIGFDSVLQTFHSIEKTFNFLLQASGVGNFMAYQYCMDFAYSKRYLLNTLDTYMWTCLGLGAVRGMNRLLFGKAIRTKIPYDLQIARCIQEEWNDEIFKNLQVQINQTFQSARLEIFDIEKATIAKLYNPFRQLHMGDVEHWLCEYDKYCRSGSKKRRYQSYDS